MSSETASRGTPQAAGQGGSPPNPSRLHEKHPDHPTLKALGVDLTDSSVDMARPLAIFDPDYSLASTKTSPSSRRILDAPSDAPPAELSSVKLGHPGLSGPSHSHPSPKTATSTPPSHRRASASPLSSPSFLPSSPSSPALSAKLSPQSRYASLRRVSDFILHSLAASSSSHGQMGNLTATPEPTSGAADSASSSGHLGGQLNQPQPRQNAVQDGNARSKSITVADGEHTFGVLNCHPSQAPESTFSFRVGVAEDRNKRCRRTMEDAHSFVYDYAGIKGQGYFAVFDGHAGKHAAEWCGQNFHEYLLDATLTYPDQPVPDLFNKTFHTVDARLSHLANTGRTSSGSTAAVAFLRCEKMQDDEPKGFSHPELKPRGLMHGQGEEELERETAAAHDAASVSEAVGGGTGAAGGVAAGDSGAKDANGSASVQRKHSGRRIRDFVRGLTGSEKRDDKNSSTGTIDEDSAMADGEGDSAQANDAVATSPETSTDQVATNEPTSNNSGPEAIEPRAEGGIRRVLYTANVGDARAVLCRKGKAVRLTYDHKGSDPQEAKRITDAGGFVMNNRVNGVLAVTRSLGDASVKEFVVGSPYTTETALDEGDEFLIVACDGLWDVCEDQSAVDIVRNIPDSQEAAKRLLDYAMTNYSTDNLSVMVIRFTHN